MAENAVSDENDSDMEESLELKSFPYMAFIHLREVKRASVGSGSRFEKFQVPLNNSRIDLDDPLNVLRTVERSRRKDPELVKFWVKVEFYSLGLRTVGSPIGCKKFMSKLNDFYGSSTWSTVYQYDPYEVLWTVGRFCRLGPTVTLQGSRVFSYVRIKV
ncbi:hypothetical protein MTR67_031465 [Solanum verrucosum]|uniref:Uncharacterized protein n=1 Tax=Solanum verrucosum TaxID=315347 RepID=A0AAF0U2H6_SOLVR|nr:hypothetical protein MTR67_031465 [Solanum verrucosum]